MPDRLEVAKTHKLYINGAFVRSESGRSLAIRDDDWAARAHLCNASRKDLRDAVRAAAAAQPAWAARDAYNRGQILYRLAEMLESRAEEFTRELAPPGAPRAHAAREVTTSIDRLVAFAGWCDKFQQVLGARNPVAGPYHNFTTPEPTGVVAVIPPDQPALLALISLLAPVLCAGNTAIILAWGRASIPACIFAEACHTSDLPPGIINILTGDPAELIPHIASHREINAVNAADLPPDPPHLATTLRAGAAENLKRIRTRAIGLKPSDRTTGQGWYDDHLMNSPWMIEPFIEFKTIWHPSAT